MLLRALIECNGVDLLYKSEFSDLKIVNRRRVDQFELFPAPKQGWTKELLVEQEEKACDLFVSFDVYLGEIWIGSSDIQERFTEGGCING